MTVSPKSSSRHRHFCAAGAGSRAKHQTTFMRNHPSVTRIQCAKVSEVHRLRSSSPVINRRSSLRARICKLDSTGVAALGQALESVDFHLSIAKADACQCVDVLFYELFPVPLRPVWVQPLPFDSTLLTHLVTTSRPCNRSPSRYSATRTNECCGP